MMKIANTIYSTNQMIPQVVANVHLFHLAVFLFHFQEDVLKKAVVMPLQLYVGDVVRHLRHRSGILRISITVLQDDSLRACGFVVQSRALSPVTTGADLEVKRTIDFVLFRAENGRQIFRHCPHTLS